MTPVPSFAIRTMEGIVGEPRYFQKKNREGRPTRRQLSLIEREQIDQHASTLGLTTIAPGSVRANVETSGIALTRFVGQRVRIGSAVVYFFDARTPCQKMDAICEGLRALMENGKQGVVAEIVESGTVSIGDQIEPLGADRNSA